MSGRDECRRCKFWQSHEENRFALYDGRCRRLPPQRMPAMMYGWALFSWTRFPATDGSDWCGEFRPIDTSGDPS